ncbi:MAG: DUF1292 domain-containing protein [Clostridiales bacterium]|nr:DUF1292 domain-containing protein [Clostridiales bacterium]
MKTNQRQNKPFSSSKKKKETAGVKDKREDELIVIRDVSNGKEYYLSIVDTFLYAKREYVVMYNYVPDDGNHADPELVIMRTEFSEKGDQRFYSIKDKDELEVVFSYFMRRYYNSSVPDKKDRVGINFKGDM